MPSFEEMEKISLVKLDLQPFKDYFMCKLCNTHIALADKLLRVYTDDGNHSLLFGQVVNLKIDEPVRHRESGGHTIADIFCVTCGDKLGLKFVEINGRVPTVGTGEYILLEIRKVKKQQCNKIVDAESIYPDNP